MACEDILQCKYYVTVSFGNKKIILPGVRHCVCPVPVECLDGGKVNIQISPRTPDPWRGDWSIQQHTRYPWTSQATEQLTLSPWPQSEQAGLQQSGILCKYLPYYWWRFDKISQQNISIYIIGKMERYQSYCKS